MTVDALRELVALQRFHARHGFGGLPPANIEHLRAIRSEHAYLSGETIPLLAGEAISVYRQTASHFPPGDPALRRLLRERGIHNVPRLLAALKGQ